MSSNPTFSRTLNWLAEGQQLGWHPGAQIYVSKDGRPLLDAAVGTARPGVVMTPETIHPWFSSGKPLTAVAIGQLVESNRLQWDSKIADWIPDFAAGGKGDLEVRHLLTHTGGFRSADSIPEDIPWEETLRQICETPLEAGARPGAQAGYHTHSSWAILAELIHRISGETFDDYLQRHIFTPAGMTNSHVRLASDMFHHLEDRLGWMHLTDRGSVDPHPFWNTATSAAILRPGAFLRGPIHDLGRFYEALLAQPSPLLGPTALTEMTRRQREGMFDDTFKHKIDFGYGLIINSQRFGMETVPYGFGRHASESAFGHGGVQSSCAFADPVHGLVVAWVCNGLPGIRIHHKRGRELNTAIYQDLGLGG